MKEKKPEYGVYRNFISTQFPHLSVQTFKLCGEGVRNRVFLVNEEWIFRFPKDAVGARETEKEIQVLPVLKPYLTIRIPEFIYIGKQENGWPFVGYSVLQGHSAAEKGFAAWDAEEKKRLEEAVSQFISEMRSFPVERGMDKHIPQRDYFADYTALERTIHKHVFPHLSTQLQQFLTEQFAWYLNDETHFHYASVLLHGDLSCDHLLLHPTSRQLIGIIDFGDMVIGDPVYEFLYLLEECGEEFVLNILENCGEKNPTLQMRKVVFFRVADTALYLLEGLQKNDSDQIEEAIALLTEMKQTLSTE